MKTSLVLFSVIVGVVLGESEPAEGESAAEASDMYPMMVGYAGLQDLQGNGERSRQAFQGFPGSLIGAGLSSLIPGAGGYPAPGYRGGPYDHHMPSYYSNPYYFQPERHNMYYRDASYHPYMPHSYAQVPSYKNAMMDDDGMRAAEPQTSMKLEERIRDIEMKLQELKAMMTSTQQPPKS